MQDEQRVERFLQDGIWLVADLGDALHHREEVAFGEREVVVRVDIRHPHVVAIGEGGEGRHLGDQPIALQPPVVLVVDVLGLGIESRERPDSADQHPHRVGVVAKTFDEGLHVLVNEGVGDDLVREVLELGRVGQFAVQEQVGDLEVARVLGQLLDGVTPVHQDALVAVDVGDAAAGDGGVEGVARIVGHHAEVVGLYLDLPQVHGANRVSRSPQARRSCRCGCR